MIAARPRRTLLVVAVAAVAVLSAIVVPGGAPGDEARAAAAGPTGELEIGELGIQVPITKSSFKLTQATGASGSGAGETSFGPMVVQKGISLESPSLMQTAATGAHLGEVVVRVFQPGTTKLVVTYELTGVVITSFEQAGVAERLALSYRTLEMTVARNSSCVDVETHGAC